MDWLTTVANGLAILCVLLCVSGWIVLMTQRERCFVWKWFPKPTDRPKPVIGLLDVFVAFVLLIFAGSVELQFATPPETVASSSSETAGGDSAVSEASSTKASDTGEVTPTEPTRRLVTRGTSQLLVVVLMIAWLVVRHRATLSECGVPVRRLWDEIRLGVVSSLLLIPLVLAIQVALVNLAGIDYQHQTLETMKQSTSTAFWMATFFSAGLATPILEEYLYRYLIQGWIQRVISTMRRSAMTSSHPVEPSTVLLLGGRSDQEVEPRAETGPWFAVVLASLFFAAAHLGQGPAPIPLFAFAVGLGFLRWKSGSVIAPIFVHMVLNLFTLSMLTLNLVTS